MSGSKSLAEPRDVRYIYDGSLVGFYCCVYESVYSREIPMDILTEDKAQPTLLRQKVIIADKARAQKVRASIPIKVSSRALELVETVYLSCLKDKELAMLRFLLIAYREGAKVTDMMGHPDVHAMLKAEKHLLGENHLLLGFIRFADYGGMLAATITPKNFVLPFLANHFISRYSEENFIIYDKAHRAALVYQDRQQRIIPVDELVLDTPPKDELRYQSLWKQFYETIAIKERINYKLRRSLMPKRYWENVPEVSELA